MMMMIAELFDCWLQSVGLIMLCISGALLLPHYFHVVIIVIIVIVIIIIIYYYR